MHMQLNSPGFAGRLVSRPGSPHNRLIDAVSVCPVSGSVPNRCPTFGIYYLGRYQDPSLCCADTESDPDCVISVVGSTGSQTGNCRVVLGCFSLAEQGYV